MRARSAVKKAFHDVKYRVRPPKYDLDSALEDAHARHAADIDRLTELEPEQVAYLTMTGEAEDPEADGIDCGGI